MTIKEFEFKEEFKALLDKYQVRLEEYIDLQRPESGFVSNYQSLRVIGEDVKLDLFELANNASY